MPIIKENPKYQGQDKLPVTIWMIAQACQGDLVVGVYMWVHYLFPMLSSKSSCSPQSRDLILQENFILRQSSSYSFLNGAVRKRERIVSPSTLSILCEPHSLYLQLESRMRKHWPPRKMLPAWPSSRMHKTLQFAHGTIAEKPWMHEGFKC